MKPEIYVSVDVEADGPCPGLNSMLSFGAVALDATKGIGREAVVAQFEANLETIQGAKPDPATARWWSEHQEAWEKCRENLQKPEVVMPRFAGWLEKLPGKPIFVGYPVAFDWPFIYYYLHRFAGGKNPFVRNAIDVESFAMGVLGKGYMEVSKRSWPEHWFDRTLKHTHVAIDDALGQGISFMRMLNDRASKVWGAPLGGPQPCPVCVRPGGAILDGPHTYGAGCMRRKFQ